MRISFTSQKAQYHSDCRRLHDGGDGALVKAMVAARKRISLTRFLKSVDFMGSPLGNGYENQDAAIADAMADDAGSGCYRSMLGESPCYFFQTKGFEFIWK